MGNSHWALFAVSLAMSVPFLSCAGLAASLGEQVVLTYMGAVDVGDWRVILSSVGTMQTDPVLLRISHNGNSTALNLTENQSTDIELSGDVINIKVTHVIPSAGPSGSVNVVLKSICDNAVASSSIGSETFVQYMRTVDIDDWLVKVSAIGLQKSDLLGFAICHGGKAKALSLRENESTDIAVGGDLIHMKVVRTTPGSGGGAMVLLSSVCGSPVSSSEIGKEAFVQYMRTAEIGDWLIKVSAIGLQKSDPVGFAICHGDGTSALSLSEGGSVNVTIGGDTVNLAVVQTVPGSGGGALVMMRSTLPVEGSSQDDTEVENDAQTDVREEMAGGRVRNMSQLHDSVESERERLSASLEGLTGDEREIRTHGNAISIAVHALLESENLTGGIGGEVSTIAREFNNSIKTREQLELRLKNRNAVLRFLFGGDEVTAKAMENVLDATSDGLSNLRALKAACNCSQEIKTEIQYQIDALQTEQDRQDQFVRREMADKGLFGWLYK